jgi:antitoxin VapB
MAEAKTAKLFRNGASQAVRLPIEFRFEGTEVYISRNDATGDVVLSARPGAGAWGEFFRRGRSTESEEAGTAEFLSDRPMNRLPVEKDVFAADEEG